MNWSRYIATAVAAILLLWLLGLGSAMEYSAGATPLHAISSNFAHWSFHHLLWDLGAFALLLAFLARTTAAPLTLMFCALLTSILAPMIAVHGSSITSYRGLSGIDAMLFVYLAALLLITGARGRDTPLLMVAAAALLGFLTKTGAEAWFDVSFFATKLGEDVVPAPLAHLVGAVIGAAGALLESFRPLSREPRYNMALQ